MKKLLLLGLVFISLYGCREQEQDPTVLPPATQEGKNTGGALVNGEVWVAQKVKSSHFVFKTYYEYPSPNTNGGEYRLKIVLARPEGSISHSLIRFFIKDTTDITTKTYILNDLNGGGYSTSTDDDYATNSQNTGSITITKFDKDKQIVSGYFQFDGGNVNGNGEVIHITQGRFDKKFIQ
ncbi:MAG: hypothetical protein CSA38_00860 [Flavobacteriales bacterium]|nr:MAG: hypothetical protein CSA38_00860 [Flavobacteriales bacterium]